MQSMMKKRLPTLIEYTDPSVRPIRPNRLIQVTCMGDSFQVWNVADCRLLRSQCRIWGQVNQCGKECRVAPRNDVVQDRLDKLHKKSKKSRKRGGKHETDEMAVTEVLEDDDDESGLEIIKAHLPLTLHLEEVYALAKAEWIDVCDVPVQSDDATKVVDAMVKLYEEETGPLQQRIAMKLVLAERSRERAAEALALKLQRLEKKKKARRARLIAEGRLPPDVENDAVTAAVVAGDAAAPSTVVTDVEMTSAPPAATGDDDEKVVATDAEPAADVEMTAAAPAPTVPPPAAAVATASSPSVSSEKKDASSDNVAADGGDGGADVVEVVTGKRARSDGNDDDDDDDRKDNDAQAEQGAAVADDDTRRRDDKEAVLNSKRVKREAALANIPEASALIVVSERIPKFADSFSLLQPILPYAMREEPRVWSKEDVMAKINSVIGRRGERFRRRCAVVNDLWRKGYYLTDGPRFGCDFLAYAGPPSKFHSAFMVWVSTPDDMPYGQHWSAIGRVATASKKMVLIAMPQPMAVNPSTLEYDTISYLSFKWHPHLSKANRVRISQVASKAEAAAVKSKNTPK